WAPAAVPWGQPTTHNFHGHCFVIHSQRLVSVVVRNTRLVSSDEHSAWVSALIPLVISGHPAHRMIERGISAGDIQSALAKYVTRIEGSGNSITYIGPGQNGLLLKVFLLKPGLINMETPVIVKSVAWHNTQGVNRD
ncbi:MAG: hypothetical protein K0U42_04810, partial [Actinomycetia bacterium]|nr:hypothetical protein [Actinomycetes bacterium]